MFRLIVFGVAILVPVASGLRIWGLYVWSTSGGLSRYYGGYVLFWSQVELNTAIVCASAPSLQPLFRRIFGELSRFQRTHNAQNYYGGHRTITEIYRGQRPAAHCAAPLSGITTPESTYLPTKRYETNDTMNDLVQVREIDEEEDIQSCVRDSSQRSSAQSQEPKSPAKPRDIFATA